MTGHLLSHLKPKEIFQHFWEVSRIPRPSKKEEGVRTYIRGVAERHGAGFEVDGAGNVLVRVSATRGCEGRPSIMLQNHMDMVCEKDPQSPHEFDRDPIALRLHGDRLMATQTTLGADNGIGLSSALAVLTDPTVQHGPLELLFTADEESGMSGAKGVSFQNIRSKILLNLDSEEPGTFTLGCAGGTDFTARMKLDRLPDRTFPNLLKVQVSGLRGGHSGIQIHENRRNAIKVLAEVLDRLVDRKDTLAFELISMGGGNLRNAIPRDSFAVVAMNDCQKSRLMEAVQEAESRLREAEPDGRIQVLPDSSPWKPLTSGCVKNLLRVLMETPSGVLEWNENPSDVVKTSNNLGVLSMTETTLFVNNLTRSLVTQRIATFQTPWKRLYEEARFEVTIENGYPGWAPKFDGPLVKQCLDAHQRVLGSPARAVVIHAGLECGLLTERLPPMEMISFGPMIYDAHSPVEYLEIPSVEPFWKLLTDLLMTLKV